VIVIILREHKFYHFRTPKWFITEEVSGGSFGSGYPLVLLKNITGEIAYIYGYYIYASEENDFRLWWYSNGKERSIRILLPGPGTVMYVNTIPINLDSPHTEGNIILYVLNEPSPESIYKAGIMASGCIWATQQW
jgi:hypothetical protein